MFFGGRTDTVFWENGRGILRSFPSAHNFPPQDINGVKILGNVGIRITQMQNFPCTLYTGEVFGKNAATLIPFSHDDLSAIWCYCTSNNYKELVRQIDQSLKVTNGTLIKVPFDLEYWTKVAAEQYPNGLPKPYSNNPTQWIFHGHPAKSDSPLQVAVARLLGYQWPAELDPEMELSDEQREWVRKSSELLSFADDDGVVCVPSVRGEPSATDRLHNLLAAAYGDSWSSNTLNELLSSVDHAGKTLDRWLRDKFFTQHCKLFQNRPFIWHIWDGLPDGFAVLVNYHKLDRRTLESLIFTYLGDWISRQKRDLENQVEGAEEKIIAAEQLKKRLELILKGEDPYDIFVRWKPPGEQPIGWEPDLNDGVRLNIRPFMSVPDVGKRGAGVLRDKPNITWGKDRGQDVETAPWYKLGPMEGGNPGDRINDHHLTLEEKKNAREKGSRGTL